MTEPKNCGNCKDNKDKSNCPWVGTGDDCGNFPDKSEVKQEKESSSEDKFLCAESVHRDILAKGKVRRAEGYTEGLRDGREQAFKSGETIGVAKGYKLGLEKAIKIIKTMHKYEGLKAIDDTRMTAIDRDLLLSEIELEKAIEEER